MPNFGDFSKLSAFSASLRLESEAPHFLPQRRRERRGDAERIGLLFQSVICLSLSRNPNSLDVYKFPDTKLC
jgi:hypothetical protein